MADDISNLALQGYHRQTADFDSLSGSINFTGLGSGTDFSAIVDQLVAIESIQKERLEIWKSTWEAKIASMQSLNLRLNAVKEASAAMDEEDEFYSRTASSSDSGVATATASSGAQAGAYRVEVGTDVPHILRSAGFGSATSDVVSGAGGELEFYIGSTLTTVGIGATDTASDIAANINTKVGSSVASVENDGTSSRAYHLVIKSPTGGDDGRIQVTKNPTDLSFGYEDVVLEDDSSWGVTGSEPAITLGGQFSGDKATLDVWQYVFTVSSSATVTVGATTIELVYNVFDPSTGTTIQAPTTLYVPSDYVAGNGVEVENGIYIQLGDGELLNGDSFSLRAFANDIDEAEEQTWSGTTITTTGNYLGTVNKTYSFTVMSTGNIDTGGNEDTITLRWTDSTGRTGTVSVSEADHAYEVDQGVMVSFTSGGLINGDTFQVNVFSPNQQQGQDKGLAQATKVVHAGFADQDVTPVTTTAATFAFTYAGEEINVSVDAGSTLSQLVRAINDDAANEGVTASIINDGLGLPDSYKLVLTGKDTGAQYQISDIHHNFSGSSFSSGGDLGGGFTRTQWATNAMVKVDGYPAEDGIYLQRETNNIEGVIPDVSVDLHDAGEVVITVSNNLNAIKGKIEALVNAINYAQNFIRQETAYDPDSDEDTGVLIGNYSYYIIKSRLDSTLNRGIDGLVDGEDVYTHLSQIGIKTDPDSNGIWTIDTNVLNNALTNNLEAVADLFIDNESKGSTGAAKRVYDELVDLTNTSEGPLYVLIDNYNGIIANIDKKIESEEKRIALYEERQLLRFSRLEATLAELNAQSSAIDSAIKQLPNS